MRTYLRTIHTRSDKHKHRFALAVSLGTTLVIFFVWGFFHFGVDAASVANADGQTQSALVAEPQTANAFYATSQTAAQTASAVTPFEALSGNIADGWNSVKAKVSVAVDNIRSSGTSDYTASNANTSAPLNSNGQ
jgi:uncharacterized protein (UPF0333 family)